MKPLLLLDVDGPLNPWAAKPTQRPAGYSTHRYTRPGAQRWDKPLRVWLHPGHGPMLLTLADRFELVWCTTWGAEANTWIGPRIGLPVATGAGLGGVWCKRRSLPPEGPR